MKVLTLVKISWVIEILCVFPLLSLEGPLEVLVKSEVEEIVKVNFDELGILTRVSSLIWPR